eukprot:SAG22_NODE_21444_length_257_cov_0.645570_1_plen_61_part_01
MLHGHPNNGTKAWIWGTAPDELFWQQFGGGVPNVKADQRNTVSQSTRGDVTLPTCLRCGLV